jgi:hypothetical protein
MVNYGSAMLVATRIVNNRGTQTGGIANLGSLIMKDGSIDANAGLLQAGALWNVGSALLIRTSLRGNDSSLSTGGAILNGAGSVELIDCSIHETAFSPAIATLAQAGTFMLRVEIRNGFQGISNEGVMTFIDGIVDGTDSGTPAVYNSGRLALENILLTDLSSAIDNGGTMSLTNSTISGNRGGLRNFGTLDLTHVTITNNESLFTADSGGITNISGVVTLRGTIVAGNRTGAVASDCRGTLRSLGRNVVQTTAGCTLTGATTQDVIGQDPLLAPLAPAGDRHAVHALLDGSAAIDAAATEGCPVIDQRGAARPYGARCDSGAFERTDGCGDRQVAAPEVCDDPASTCCSTLCRWVLPSFAGDADCNGDVTAADVTTLLIGLGNNERAACGRDDANGDCTITPADLISAIAALFSPPPP